MKIRFETSDLVGLNCRAGAGAGVGVVVGADVGRVPGTRLLPVF